MENSILKSVKKNIGIDDSYKVFDEQIIDQINTAFNVLKQLGVGPAEGFYIEDDTSEWDDFIDPGPNSRMVKTYVANRVRLKFDPPESSALMQAIKEEIAELEWRLNVDADTNCLGGTAF